MSEKSLYQDRQLRIEHHPSSSQDHILYVKEKEGEDVEYLIQRGILRELAKTPRGGIEQKINNFNYEILAKIKEEGISIDELHVVFCQAHAEEEERVKRFVQR